MVRSENKSINPSDKYRRPNKQNRPNQVQTKKSMNEPQPPWWEAQLQHQTTAIYFLRLRVLSKREINFAFETDKFQFYELKQNGISSASTITPY